MSQGYFACKQRKCTECKIDSDCEEVENRFINTSVMINAHFSSKMIVQLILEDG